MTAKPTHTASTEIELKYKVATQGGLWRIMQGLNFKTLNTTIFHQENHFFDDPSFSLRKNDLTIRLRNENEQFYLCLKGSQKSSKQHKALAKRHEVEVALTSKEAENLLGLSVSPMALAIEKSKGFSTKEAHLFEPLFSRFVQILEGKPLNYMGSFFNRRTNIPIQIGTANLVLELDETRFGAKDEEYEIELEIPTSEFLEQAQAFLTDLLQKAGVEPKAAKGKSERFYMRLRKKRG